MIPYVRWPDGTLQAESWDILDRLELESDDPLDAGLDAAALASGRALAQAIEVVCYEACLYDRFAHPKGWAVQRLILRSYVEQLAPRAARPLLSLVIWAVRRKQIERAKNTMADVPAGHARAIELVERVAHRLERSAFLCGDQPSTVDCAIWATLVHLGATPVASPSRCALLRQQQVMAWIKRVAERADFTLGTLGTTP